MGKEESGRDGGREDDRGGRGKEEVERKGERSGRARQEEGRERGRERDIEGESSDFPMSCDSIDSATAKREPPLDKREGE